MKKLPFTWRLVLAVLPVLFAAGFSFVPLSASADDASGSDDDLVYFVSLEDYYVYKTNCLEEAYYVVECIVSTRVDCASTLFYANQAWIGANAQVQYWHNLVNLGEVPPNHPQYSRSVSTRTACSNTVLSAKATLDDLDECYLAATNTVREIESDARFSTMQDSGSGGESGGCSCPDYTEILNTLLTKFEQVRQIVVRWDNQFFDVLNFLFDDYLFGSLAQGSSGILEDYMAFTFGLSKHVRSVGSTWSDFGYRIGYTVSNLWTFSNGLNNTLRLKGGLVGTGPVAGNDLDDVLWSDLMQPYAELLAPNIDSPNTDNRMVNRIRAWYLSEPYVYPTNTVDNPLWVTFTNTVSIRPEDWQPIITNTFSVELTSTNMSDLVASFSFMLEAIVTNHYYIETSATAASEAFLSSAQDALDENEEEGDDPEQDHQELPDASSSISELSRLGQYYTTIVDAYVGMFDAIPSDPPADIMIWDGYTGEIDEPDDEGLAKGKVDLSTKLGIKSLHWKPMEDSGQPLNMIRGLFSCAWFIVYVGVIFYAIAIDLFIAGVCVYMVYGLLLGKPQVAIDGCRYMFQLLCSILGWKAPGGK